MCKRGFIRLAIILEMILYETLHMDMGQNIAKEEGLDSFEIKAREVKLVLPPIFPDLWTYCTILIRSCFIKYQHLW